MIIFFKYDLFPIFTEFVFRRLLPPKLHTVSIYCFPHLFIFLFYHFLISFSWFAQQLNFLLNTTIWVIYFSIVNPLIFFHLLEVHCISNDVPIRSECFQQSRYYFVLFFVHIQFVFRRNTYQYPISNTWAPPFVNIYCFCFGLCSLLFGLGLLFRFYFLLLLRFNLSS